MSRRDLNDISAEEFSDRVGVSLNLGREAIKFRRLFGGYAYFDQLHAVPGMTPQIVTKVQDVLSIEVNDRRQQMINIQLNNTANLSYLGHHVTLNFSKRSILQTPAGVEAVVWSGEQLAADCSADGQVTFILPTDLNENASVYLRVFANDGSLLLRQVIACPAIGSTLSFDVLPLEEPFPDFPRHENDVSSESFMQTLITLVEKARRVGVHLIEAPVF